MKLYRFILLLGLPAFAACSRGPEPQSLGEAYFKGYGCVKCHALGEEGTAWGPDLTFIGFRKSPEWLDLWLRNPHAWNPKTIMPNFNLPEGVRRELVSYLSQQKGQAWRSGRPWQHPELQGDPVKKGQVLFAKAGCVACHGDKGLGGYPNNNVVGGLIPSLAKVAEGYTKEELIVRIKNGVISAPADPSQPQPMVFMPKWGDVLKEDELSAVADYLFSLRKNVPSADSW